jgi:hypothetical protein
MGLCRKAECNVNSRHLFAGLRSGREGVQFERMLRLLSFLLSGWSGYTGRRPDPDYPSAEMLAIPFDKLVAFVARIWDELHRQCALSPKDLLVSAPSSIADKESITFPCPLVELRGKHGSGRAVVDGGERPPDFVVTLIYKLQSEELPYFVVTPPRSRSSEKTVDPSNPATTVRPGLPIQDPKRFLKGFTEREVEVLRELDRVVRMLTQSELRALGTHSSYAAARDHCEHEFVYLVRRQVVEKLVNAIEDDRDFLTLSLDLQEYSVEVCRKADENRSSYESAFGIVERELTDPRLKQAFLSSQSSSSAIWPSGKLDDLLRLGRSLRALSDYLIAISHVAKAIGKGKEIPVHLVDALRRSSNAIRKSTSASVPDSAAGVFVPNSRTVRPALKQALVTMLGELRSRFPQGV